MAKERERQLAKELYVEQHQSASEIAKRIHVTEKTMGTWVKKYGWKKERNAKLHQSSSRLENIKKVIASLTERRIAIIQKLEQAEKNADEKAIMDLQKEAVKIDDGISKWNKTLESFDKENRISLAIYLEVMNDIFENLRKHDKQTYLKTLDFQDDHLSTISIKIG